MHISAKDIETILCWVDVFKHRVNKAYGTWWWPEELELLERLRLAPHALKWQPKLRKDTK